MSLAPRVSLFVALFLGASLTLAGQNAGLLQDLNAQVPALLAGTQPTSDPDHTPRLRVPRLVEVAGEVAVTVTVPLVGDDKHYIRRVALIDENSVVKLKYLATFSPAVRHVEVATLIKMAKTSRLKAVVECSLHGKWLGVSDLIQVGMSGCGAGGEPSRKIVGEVLRVRFQEEGAGVQTNLLFRHPMVSGYVMTGGGLITKSYEPFFLRMARVTHKDQVFAEFQLGPGLSENPRIALSLPRLGGEPLKAEAVNTMQQHFVLMARMPQ